MTPAQAHGDGVWVYVWHEQALSRLLAGVCCVALHPESRWMTCVEKWIMPVCVRQSGVSTAFSLYMQKADCLGACPACGQAGSWSGAAWVYGMLATVTMWHRRHGRFEKVEMQQSPCSCRQLVLWQIAQQHFQPESLAKDMYDAHWHSGTPQAERMPRDAVADSTHRQHRCRGSRPGGSRCSYQPSGRSDLGLQWLACPPHS